MLNILVEPGSYLPLALEDALYDGDEIISGRLKSPSGSTYSITNGIPRFVETDNYTSSFGVQWNRFAGTQLDSRNGCRYSQARFSNEVNWGKDWVGGKLILDAGCGSGRFAEIALALGCRLVAIDMSSAIDAAKANIAGSANVTFVQASIYRLPFRPGTFDGLYSIGVIQHTPDPREALGSLLSVVRRDGRFAVTIYGRAAWTKLYSKYWVRSIISGLNLSNEKLLQAVEKAMPFAFKVTNILFRIPVAKKIFRFIIPVANYVEKDDMTEKQRYEEAVLDTFDMLSPKYDNPMTVSEIENVLKTNRIKEYRVLSKRPVNIVGVR